MATFKRINDEIEISGRFALRDVFKAIHDWSKSNGFKNKGTTSESFSPEPLSYSQEMNFSKTISKWILGTKFAHKIKLSINISGKKENEMINGTLKIDIEATLSDNEKDNPTFSWKHIMKRRLIDVYIKAYDERKSKDLDKAVEDLKSKIMSIVK